MDIERLIILYGSQTGTAQDAAESLGRRLKSRRDILGNRLCIKVLPMDDYPIKCLLDEEAAIFICSTTGQGEEPDNMKCFWSFLLRKDLPAKSLRQLKFAVLGLGDSSYMQFNFAAKKLYRRLLQLQANPLLKLALCDDQHDLGTEAVLDPWSLSLVDLFMPITGVVISPKLKLTSIAPPKFKIKVCGHLATTSHSSDCYIGAQSNAVMAKLVGNERLTAPAHFQDVRLLKLDVSFKCGYSEGDVLMVQPQNLEENIDEFFRILHGCVDKDTMIALKSIDPDIPLPQGIITSSYYSWQKCVRHLFDLQASPRHYFYEILRHFSTNELERDKLDEFLSQDGQRELYNYGFAMRRTCLEVLQDFPHSARAIPCEYYFDLFSIIRARAFSIASSSSMHPDQVHLLVAVVKYYTKLLKPRSGLCSTWLSRLTASSEIQIPVWLRRGSFKFPEDPLIPLIMIGPGTGCAPFRSYLQHRVQFLRQPGCFLFYGCRNKGADFFFKEEWFGMQLEGLLHLYVAFSRDQQEKIYVQHKLLENGQAIWNMINTSGAYVLLAGNAKQMPQDVRFALQKVFQQHGNMDVVAANDYLKMLERSKRFQSETWS